MASNGDVDIMVVLSDLNILSEPDFSFLGQVQGQTRILYGSISAMNVSPARGYYSKSGFRRYSYGKQLRCIVYNTLETVAVGEDYLSS